jgi:hypothetical protein
VNNEDTMSGCILNWKSFLDLESQRVGQSSKVLTKVDVIIIPYPCRFQPTVFAMIPACSICKNDSILKSSSNITSSRCRRYRR